LTGAVRHDNITPKWYICSKLKELKILCRQMKSDTALFIEDFVEESFVVFGK
jgi:hypothetical protein